MIFAIITLLSGLSISIVAAYYSIIGLTTIFSGSVMAVAIMGAVLEVGKLVTASWLKQNWKSAGLLMKSYLTIAVIVLMFITSMGIFGYLSKAHLQQTSGINYNHSKIEKINFDITQQEKKIERSQAILDQLDKALEAYIEREYITRALKERAKQKEEREVLQTEIKQATEKIDQLNEKKFMYQQEVQEIEVEVGPLKYIADLIYGEEKSKDMLNEAVRAVILILIFVFDPLAILMLLAANISFVEAFQKRKAEKKKKKVSKKILDFADSLEEPETSMFVGASSSKNELNSEKSKIEDLSKSTQQHLNFDKKNNNSINPYPWISTSIETTRKEANNTDKQEPNLEKQDKKTKFSGNFWEDNGFTKNKNKTEKIKDNWPDGLPINKPENMKEKDWQDKLLKQAENITEQLRSSKAISMLTKEEMLKAVDESFTEAIGKANIPFNLNSPEGEELKRILIRNLQKKYKPT